MKDHLGYINALQRHLDNAAIGSHGRLMIAQEMLAAISKAPHKVEYRAAGMTLSASQWVYVI